MELKKLSDSHQSKQFEIFSHFNTTMTEINNIRINKQLFDVIIESNGQTFQVNNTDTIEIVEVGHE